MMSVRGGLFHLVLPALLLALVLVPIAQAATVVVDFSDPNDGFHSTAPLDPVSTAPGLTLGEQRMASFSAASADWGARLVSNVSIVIDARMRALACDASGGVLGAAGALNARRDWTPGVGGSAPPLANTWYHSALANKIANVDLIPAGSLASFLTKFESDVQGIFNDAIDNNDNCISGTNWFYATSKQTAPVGTISFYNVILHEIAHGLGVSTFVDTSGGLNTGLRLLGANDVYMSFLEDHSTGKTWAQMSDGERNVSMTDDTDLHWIGPRVTEAITLLNGGVNNGHVAMYAPPVLQTGSSVSHWDVSVSAPGGLEELMEPFATGSETILITDKLLEDEGWGPVVSETVCGNGILDAGEVCDDGNEISGDGCNQGCTVEAPCFVCDAAQPSVCTPNNGVACDDGDQCTADQCLAGVCVGTPQTGTACDDGRPCTTDTCSAGVCVGSSASCSLAEFRMARLRRRIIRGASAPTIPSPSMLVDSFESKQTDIDRLLEFGAASDIGAAMGTPMIDLPDIGLNCYKIKDTKTLPPQPRFTKRKVMTTHQFGSETLKIGKPKTLCLPASASFSTGIGAGLIPPAPAAPLTPGLADAYKCYKAAPASGSVRLTPLSTSIIGGPIQPGGDITFKRATLLCAPVDKDGGGIIYPTAFLECFKIKALDRLPTIYRTADLSTKDEFGDELLMVKGNLKKLCIVATKTDLPAGR